MQLYTIRNKGKNVIRVFADSPERAKDIALNLGHARLRENLFIAAEKPAPKEYHEGVASRKISSERLNLETMQFESDDDPASLGWYGGSKQQPKVENEWWN